MPPYLRSYIISVVVDNRRLGLAQATAAISVYWVAFSREGKARRGFFNTWSRLLLNRLMKDERRTLSKGASNTSGVGLRLGLWYGTTGRRFLVRRDGEEVVDVVVERESGHTAHHQHSESRV